MSRRAGVARAITDAGAWGARGRSRRCWVGLCEARMPHHELLGRMASLPVLRFGPPGAFLAIDDGAPERPGGPTILLPGAEVPEGVKVGDRVEVFVHLDSEDRPIATTREPAVRLGEVAFLEVSDVTPFGAFCRWGLMKDLLVPKAEQTRDVRVGERHPVGLYLDDTDRLAGTMRVSEMLREVPRVTRDEWVEGVAFRRDPDIGTFIIVARKWIGLLPAAEPNRLGRGDAARFRIATILPDGKVELSLRDLAHRQVDKDEQGILEVLGRRDAPKIGDKSSPDHIFSTCGLSKKAFKRAVGGLLKKRLVTIDGDGFVALEPRRR